MAVENVAGLFRGGNEGLNFQGADSMVQRIGRGNCADEDEHDQAHALLAIVRTVKEADTGTGKNKQSPDGPRWRRVAFRSFVKRRILDEALGQNH